MPFRCTPRPPQISARAVFSKYAVTPARGVHFGPVTYNTASKPKVIEITNLGTFEFRYRLFRHADGPPPPPAPDVVKGKGAAAPAAKPKPGAPVGALAIGPFNFDAPEGTIPPGEAPRHGLSTHAWCRSPPQLRRQPASSSLGAQL
jgi:hydrocephalus-inducing protein